MPIRLIKIILLLTCAILWTACFGSGSESGESSEMAANLGLARKGLSPSEVDLPCTQTETPATLKVVSCRVYRQMGETVHLVGEVENVSDDVMDNVSIEAIGYSSEETVMDTKSDTAYLLPVQPGQRTPFRIFFDARDVADIQLTVVGDAADAEAMTSLEVSNVAISDPSSGFTHITGDVVNPSSDPMDGILIAILRDENDEAVEIHRQTLIEPLPPGTSTFDVLAQHRSAQRADVVILPK